MLGAGLAAIVSNVLGGPAVAVTYTPPADVNVTPTPVTLYCLFQTVSVEQVSKLQFQGGKNVSADKARNLVFAAGTNIAEGGSIQYGGDTYRLGVINSTPYGPATVRLNVIAIREG